MQPSLQKRRFFSATAMAGRLYVQGVPDKGPWDPRGFVYWAEDQVDAILNPRVGDRKIRSSDQLRNALRASAMRGLPTVKLWIAEGLEDAAMEWERTSKRR